MRKKHSGTQILTLLLICSLLLGSISVLADGRPVIGTLVVTNTNNVNLRSGPGTNFSIIGKAVPGDIFEVLSQASTGWFEILLDNGTTGYLSDRLVTYTPGTGAVQQVPGGVSGVRATITVSYRDQQGQVLANDYVTLAYGTNIISANDTKVPAGYALASSRRVTVNVSAQGVATPGAVIFTYGGGAQSAQTHLPVYYKDIFGSLLNTGYATLSVGSHRITPDNNLVPADYALVGPLDVVVSVSGGLSANPSAVTFLYTRRAATPPPPSAAVVPVFYRSISGAYLNTAYLSLQAGYHTVTYNQQLVPAGYSLVSAGSVAMNVDARGAATPASVTFTFAQPSTPPPARVVSIPVNYRSSAGALLGSVYVSVTQGSNTVRAQDNNVPAGYTLSGNRDQIVNVDAAGNAYPNTVTFTYREPQNAVNARIAVIHQDNLGNQFNVESVLVSNQSNNQFTANDALVPPGYVLVSPRTVSVTVSAQGAPNPAQVAFTYQEAPSSAVNARIAVIHQDNQGNQFKVESVLVSSAGNNQFVADDSLVPAGFVLVSPRTVNVTVSAQGAPNPAQVVFTYRIGAQPQPPAAAGYIPTHVQTRPNSGSYPVYTGPGEGYYRVGRATLGGGSIRVYGQENGWVLIGYGLSNGGYRIGFVTMNAMPSGINPTPLSLVRESVTNVSNSMFVDDPIVSTNRELKKTIPAGSPFTFLAYLNDFWAYVEIDNFEGSGKPARGFVSRRSLGI